MVQLRNIECKNCGGAKFVLSQEKNTRQLVFTCSSCSKNYITVHSIENMKVYKFKASPTEKEKKLLLKSLNKKKIKQVKNILEKDKEVLTRLSRL